MTVCVSMAMQALPVDMSAYASGKDAAGPDIVSALFPKTEDSKAASSQSAGAEDGEKSADGSSPSSEAATSTAEYEKVTFEFDGNEGEVGTNPVSGSMREFEFTMDGKPHKLPKNEYERKSYEFLGWGLTKDGKDVLDNPDTPDIDETFKSLLVADELEMIDLNYDEEVEERTSDANGDEVVTRRRLPRNLEYARKNDRITLYAQWRKSPRTTEPVDEPTETAEQTDATGKDRRGTADGDEDSDDDGDGDDGNSRGPEGTAPSNKAQDASDDMTEDARTSDDASARQAASPVQKPSTTTEQEDAATGNDDASPETVTTTPPPAAQSASPAPADEPTRPAETTGTTDSVADSDDVGIDVSLSSSGESTALTAHGDASDEGAVANALVRKASIDRGNALAMARNLLGTEGGSGGSASTRGGDASDDSDDPDDHRQGDGSQIESISARWITEDTTDNGDPRLLYLAPPSDSPIGVRMRINYALSGEHNYDAGDVTITIPAKMFSYRNGSDAGTMTIPFPEDPTMTDDFNWKRVGDTYVLTNTRQMSAATKGYIEFAIDGLVPHRLVDMATTTPFSAKIEVVTHRDNTIWLESNDLVAQVDTEERVTHATKQRYGAIWMRRDKIPYSLMPASLRDPDEEWYVIVQWYMWANVTGNTEFTLDVTDTVTDGYDGFILNAGSLPTKTWTRNGVINGYKEPSNVDYQVVSVAYPGSQFEPDTQYTFENSVTYTLVEKDPAVGDDPRLVTEQTASATNAFAWHMPRFVSPTGHFMVNKIGNDGSGGRNEQPYDSHTYRWESTLADIKKHNTDDGYGVYPTALNDLADGNPVEVAYTVESIGYVLPWTCEGDYKVLENYGKRPVTMITYDTDETVANPVRFGENGPAASLGTDYEYVAVEFPVAPEIGSAKAINLKPDGSFSAIHAGDGSVDYTRDSNMTHIPDVILQARIGSTWVDVASASWKTEELILTSLRPDCLVDGNRIGLPAGTEQIRTAVEVSNAYIWYYIRPIMRILPSQTISDMVRRGFAATNTPTFEFTNTTYMRAYADDGTEIDKLRHYSDGHDEIVDIHKHATNKLSGYTTDIWAYPAKSSKQEIQDVDYDARRVTIHYSAEVAERSVIPQQVLYEQALEDGRITPEESGIWYDLLPKGMSPVVDSVVLRDGDRILDAYAIENFHGSGRTLLVVETALTPVAEQYKVDGLGYYQDRPTISFDATYDFASLKDYGDRVHNVVAFESLSRNPIGTVEGYSGEDDDPNGTGSVFTERAFANDAEKAAMTDIDPDPSHSGARFVYAGNDTVLNFPSAARTSLHKEVQVNNDGIWGTGTYEQNFVVNEGGSYMYRLRMISDADTISKDLILYDALETFSAGQGNDPVDIGAPKWQGTLLSVDTSQLVDRGIAPIVYYSTTNDLQLSDETDPTQGKPVNLNLENSAVWVSADAYEREHTDAATGRVDLSGVHAIAVDCRKATDGSDYELAETDSIAVIVRMHAPYGQPARDYIAQDAHAYNNAYLTCTSIDADTGVADSDNFVRKDYTKVGLQEFSISVRKDWNDDDNRDGIRPTSVMARLLANGTECASHELAGEDWEHTFESIPYTDSNGNAIRYTIVEDPVPGYSASIRGTGRGRIIENKHEPERMSVRGIKTWVGDDEAIRPQSIRLTLYKSVAGGDEEAVTSKDVSADATGAWSYSFDGLMRYENGQEIDYRVEEQTSPSYMVGQGEPIVSEDGSKVVTQNFTNTYHPYGDLELSKRVVGATHDFLDRQFAVTFRLSTADGEPVPDTFDYDVMEGDDRVDGGTVSNGESLHICGGQRIVIHEIPEGLQYEFREEVPDGYEITESSELSGAIRPNAMTQADIENTYSATGFIGLEATKTLTGHEMRRYQFRFRIYDETDGSLVKTGANAADGTVSFGSIYYTEADAGHTYTYRITEVDRGAGGYAYDDTEWLAAVTVTDNGDGTLSTSVTYRKDEDGSVAAATPPTFANEYHASGEVRLRAWKSLRGRDLQEGEFSFDLVDEDGTILQTKANAADGLILFDPIQFDEGDAGKTFRYSVRERKGDDPTVVYDTSVIGYQIAVTDNDDGTLSFSQEQKALPTWDAMTAEERALRPWVLSVDGGVFVYDPDLVVTETDVASSIGISRAQQISGDDSYYCASYRQERFTSISRPEWSTLAVFLPSISSTLAGLTNSQDGLYNAVGERQTGLFPGFMPSSPTASWNPTRFTEDAIASHEFPVIRGDLDAVSNTLMRKAGVVPVTDEDYIDVIFITGSNPFDRLSALLGSAREEGSFESISPVKSDADWDGNDATPIFTNGLRDGNLSITKATTGAIPDEHADDTFKFKVRLTGENAPTDEIRYAMSELNPPTATTLVGDVNPLTWLQEVFRPHTAYATATDVPYTVTYDAGEGQFPDGTTTNQMVYSWRSYDDRACVRSDNINADGERTGDWEHDTTQVTMECKVVSFPGASTMHIEVDYGMTSDDRLWVINGTYDETQGIPDRYATLPNQVVQLSGSPWQSTPSHETYDVAGDTITILLRRGRGYSYENYGFDKYGYYAVVTRPSELSCVSGTYKEPTGDGWHWFGPGNDGLPDSHENYDSDVTLTAKWQKAGGMYRGVDYLLTNDGKLTIGSGGRQEFEYLDPSESTSTGGAPSLKPPWADYASEVTEVHFDGTFVLNGDHSSMFKGLSCLTSFDIDILDMTQCESTAYMFAGLTCLTQVDLTSQNLSHVSNMYGMFSNCSNLTGVDFADGAFASVTTTDYMFNNCTSLASADFSNQNFAHLSSCDDMFYNVGDSDTFVFDFTGCTFGTDIGSMLAYAKFRTADFSDSDMSNVTSMSSLLYRTTTRDESNLIMRNCTMGKSIANMCYYSGNLDLVDLTGSDFSRVEEAAYAFMDSGARRIIMPNANLTNCRTAMGMFKECLRIEYVDLHGMRGIMPTTLSSPAARLFNAISSYGYTGSGIVVDMHDSVFSGSVAYMLASSSSPSCFASIDLSGCDFGAVTDAQSLLNGVSQTVNLSGITFPQNCWQMFYGATCLTDVDLTDCDMSRVRQLGGCFSSCSNLRSIKFPAMDLSATTLMDLRNLANPSQYLSPDRFIDYMFSSCSNLESIDMSEIRFPTQLPEVPNAPLRNSMFSGCSKLSRVSVGEGFDFANTSLPSVPVNDTYDGQWLHLDDDATMTSEELMAAGPTDGTYVWLGTPTRMVRYDPNGGNGTAVTRHIVADEGYRVAANPFSYPMHVFMSYNTQADGSGVSYLPGQVVQPPADLDETIVLYAQWSLPNHQATIVNNEFEIEMPAGYVANFPDLPAGTAYSIYEETPDGWVLVSQSGTSGTIEPLQTSRATLTNQWQGRATSAQLVGVKTLDGIAADENAFSFELSEGASVIQTLSTGKGGSVMFSPITYDSTGEHDYVIREVVGSDENIQYDTHEEHVHVSVTETGEGTLRAAVAYDSDGISFANKSVPGKLTLAKEVIGRSEANKDDEFEFEVRLSNPNGQPVDNARMRVIPAPATALAGNPLEFLADAFLPHEAKALTSGWTQCGTCEWKVTEGELVIRPIDGGSTGTLDEWGTGWNDSRPWDSEKESITSVRFEGTVTAVTCAYMFSEYPNLSTANLTGLDTSGVTSMNSMFASCRNLTTVNLGTIDTSNVASFAYMFEKCGRLETLDMERFDTSSATSMACMFRECTKLRALDISHWNMSKVTTLEEFAGYCSSLTSFDAHGRTFESLTNVQYMFQYCTNLATVDFSNANLEFVELASYFAQYCDNLETIDLSGSNVCRISEMNRAFLACPKLKLLDMSHMNLTNLHAGVNSLSGSGGDDFTVDLSYTKFGTNINEFFSNAHVRHLKAHAADFSTWSTSLEFTQGIRSDLLEADFSNAIFGTNMERFFAATRGLLSINLDKSDFSRVNNMSRIFESCPKLEVLDFSTVIRPNNLTGGYGAFQNCSSLRYLNISYFDLSAVQSASEILSGTGAPGFVIDASYVKFPISVRKMFSIPNLRHLIATGADLTAVTGQYETYGMFENAGRNIAAGCTVDFSNSTWGATAYYAFASSNCTTVVLDDADMTAVTDMMDMFYSSMLEHLSWRGIRTHAVTTMYQMFSYAPHLARVEFSGFDTPNLTSINYMFNGSSSLQYADLRDLDVQNVTGGQLNMFSGSGRATGLVVDISGWELLSRNLEYMFKSDCFDKLIAKNIKCSDASGSAMYAFAFCQASEIDLSGSDFGGAIDCSHMFYSMSNLNKLDLSNTKMEHATDISYMFCYDNYLTEFSFANSHLPNASNLAHMFTSCYEIRHIDLSGLTSQNVTNLDWIFQGCRSLEDFDLSNVDAPNCDSMNYMFQDCRALKKIDLSHLHLPSTTSLDGMLANCTSLEYANLSSLDTSGISTNARVFGESYETGIATTSSLSTIVVGENATFGKLGAPNIPPSEDPYDGTWKCIERSDDTYEAMELKDLNLGGGTYVWNTDSSYGTVTFDANGGMTDATSIGSDSTPVNITMPDATRDGFFLREWNTAVDGTGRHLAAGSSYNDVLELGEHKILYAQWRKGQKYIVNTYCQNMTQDGYDLVRFETRLGDMNATETVTPAPLTGYVTPASQVVSLTEGASPTVDFFYDRTSYDVSYDGNGADRGSMGTQHFVGGIAQELWKNTFGKLGGIFLGWAEDALSDIVYTDGQTVVDIGDDGDTVQMFAKWLQIPLSPSETNGIYTIRLKGGETLEMLDLPAGTRYEIIESGRMPEGWSQVSTENASGTIVAGGLSEAVVTNEYSAKGEVTVEAWKRLTGRELQAGEFDFTLANETNRIVGRASNEAIDQRETIPSGDGESEVENGHRGTGRIVFPAITITAPGTYEYAISEIAGDDQSIDYDKSLLIAYITAVDTGHGQLQCDVTYANGDDTFDNSVKPGALTLSKAITGSQSTDQEFSFDVHLTDTYGKPIEVGSLPVNKVIPFFDSGTVANGYTEESYFDRDSSDLLLTYDANGGYFGSGSAYNMLGYESVTPNPNDIEPAYSYTVSRNADNSQNTDYYYTSGNNVIRGQDRNSSSSYTHVVRLFPAASLDVTITYASASVSDAYLAMWQGSRKYWGISSYTSASVTGRLGGGSSATPATVHYTVPGDTVSFGWEGRLRSSDNPYQYGYYATIRAATTHAMFSKIEGSGTYMEPANASSGKRFAGWYTTPECTSGSEFDLEKVDESTKKMTVYAKWTSLSPTSESSSAEVDAGTVSVSMKAGESITLSGIPAGTHYAITETGLPGWRQVGSVGEGGTIAAATTSTASFTNEYRAEGSFSVSGTKTIVGQPLNGGEYAFVLTDGDGNVVRRATNLADGSFSFADMPIDPSWAGTTRAYHVAEVAGDDPDIIYDTHIEDVSVIFSDDGQGHLLADASYDTDGCKFVNKRKIPMPAAGNSGIATWMFWVALGLLVIGLVAARRHRKHSRACPKP